MIFIKEMLHLAAVIAKSILTKFRKDEQDVNRNSAQDTDETSSLYDTVHRRRYKSNRTSETNCHNNLGETQNNKIYCLCGLFFILYCFG